MANRNIIVAGASAGGVEALKNFVKGLPHNIKASIFIVLHIPSYSKSYLPQILSKVTSLNVLHPEDGEKIKEGHIYVALPDHHLLIEEDRVAVKKGPKENRFRPSIDALFRSAAYAYESRVIGIVLSGALDDGTSGLWSIKRFGGTAIIQEPAEATFPEMPLNAMDYVEIDHILPVEKMGELLATLTTEPAQKISAISDEEKKLLEMEVAISTNDNAFEMGIIKQGKLTPLTCPECKGVLISLVKGKIMEYRCHTGHSFTASALLAGITEVVEQMLSQAMRGMEESTMLLENIAKHFKENDKNDAAEIFERKAKLHAKKARLIHDLISQEEPISEDIRFSDDIKDLHEISG